MTRILAVALITAGIVILSDAVATLAWKEPLSTVYGSFKQSAAQDQLDRLSSSFLSDPEVRDVAAGHGSDAAEKRRAARLADLYAERIENGQGIGRIGIDSIGIDFVLIEGTDTADLQKGPGHYPDTGLPGQGRTIGIAGHRTTYLAPFRRIDAIDVGDEVELDMPYGKFTYRVTKTDVVDPTDVGIVDDTGRERLVLTACHPVYSAAQRYAIFADLEKLELK